MVAAVVCRHCFFRAPCYVFKRLFRLALVSLWFPMVAAVVCRHCFFRAPCNVKNETQDETGACVGFSPHNRSVFIAVCLEEATANEDTAVCVLLAVRSPRFVLGFVLIMRLKALALGALWSSGVAAVVCRHCFIHPPCYVFMRLFRLALVSLWFPVVAAVVCRHCFFRAPCNVKNETQDETGACVGFSPHNRSVFIAVCLEEATANEDTAACVLLTVRSPRFVLGFVLTVRLKALALGAFWSSGVAAVVCRHCFCLAPCYVFKRLFRLALVPLWFPMVAAVVCRHCFLHPPCYVFMR